MVGVMLGENFGGWNFGFKKFEKSGDTLRGFR